MTVNNLDPSEYNSYYQTYLKKTEGLNINSLHDNFRELLAFLLTIPIEKQEYRYAQDKWTLKEVIQHMIDTERIFTYRALRIARQDQTPLSGFDQDMYVLPSRANQRSFQSLLEEYKAVKTATVALFESFDQEMLMQMGTASNFPISVRALGFIIMGHENHHRDIIKERYL